MPTLRLFALYLLAAPFGAAGGLFVLVAVAIAMLAMLAGVTDWLLAADGRRVRLAGASTEFERVREYLPDDEFRHINWKATARRGQPMVNQYEAERSQNLVVLLDAGRAMAALAEPPTREDDARDAGLTKL